MQKYLNQRLVAIKQVNKHTLVDDAPLHLELVQPKGALSHYVQGLWSAYTLPESTGDVTRWLQADACSGVIFILKGCVLFNEQAYSDATLFAPMSQEAQSITLLPNTQLAGIRFQPGIGNGVLADLNIFEKKEMHDLKNTKFITLADSLSNIEDISHQIIALETWLNHEFEFDKLIPPSFMSSLNVLKNSKPFNDAQISQRQVERLFKKWVGMPPKMFQRISRVKHTLNALKNTPHVNLVQLALDYGYSDQSHMTREIKNIAKITPKQYSKLVCYRKNNASASCKQSE
ncbi:helix-turn-helix domain-containing protein [Pseudomonas sp. HK3]